MMTNGRSTRRKRYQVKATDPQRRALWLRLFGVDVLPVKRPYPEEFAAVDGAIQLAYVLDSNQLTAQQLHNLASYLQARTWGLSYQDAQQRARERWTISAEGVELVTPTDDETAVSETKRPFFIAGRSALFVAAS